MKTCCPFNNENNFLYINQSLDLHLIHIHLLHVHTLFFNRCAILIYICVCVCVCCISYGNFCNIIHANHHEREKRHSVKKKQMERSAETKRQEIDENTTIISTVIYEALFAPFNCVFPSAETNSWQDGKHRSRRQISCCILYMSNLNLLILNENGNVQVYFECFFVSTIFILEK